ncbi:hypothetical protein [Pseudoclavibacter helvolus]|uniref:hypothetical protein n=1 Tax=Pseudoclavibacter helvolus TaxID=255205 RepID=UPI003C726838
MSERNDVNFTDDDPRERPGVEHQSPAGVDEATVAAVGKVTEALEMVDQARGLLYGFHRLTGAADLALGEASEALRDAGHAEIADRLDEELVGRNVIEGRWTFQVVEDYDETYWEPFRAAEREVRERLVGGRRHLAEAAMKEDRRTHGARDHEARPAEDA